MLTEGKQGRLVSLPPSVFCSVQRWLFVNEMTPSGRLTEAEHELCFFVIQRNALQLIHGEKTALPTGQCHPPPLLNVGCSPPAGPSSL